MKNFLIAFLLLLTVGGSAAQAQTVTDSWSLGFGLTYPRFSSVNITATNTNYGLYLSLQRNFSEHVGLRVKGGYSHLEGEWTNASLNLIEESTNIISGDIDLLYYLVPCDPVSPYLFAGVGANYKTITNGQTAYPDDNKFGSQLNAGGGVEFKISPNWSLVTEFGYHVTNNSELEGTIVPIEINGRDSYIVFNAGFNFFFGKGEDSKQCKLYQGLSASDMTNYARIEDMIKNHIPKEVIKEVIKEVYVDKYILADGADRLVLVGIKFAFDKSDLLPESYYILDKGVKLLEDRTEYVEIEGFTDYIGTDEYNYQLSLDRANTVRDYLISKGIDKNRLTVVGHGKAHPIADNTTELGRSLNRRIIFRIIPK